MKLLKSKKFEIPELFFITKKEELKKIPIGVPFFFGDESLEENIIRLLEYEILYQAAVKTGYPFNFKKILSDNGYYDIEDFWYSFPIYMELKTEESSLKEIDDYSFKETRKSDNYKNFIKDSAAIVNIEKLKDLNVFPIWLENIENAISTNIHNFATYNDNMYNKKLEGMYGAIDLKSPNRNLIIIDISGSIPKAVSSTCLTLSKNLSEAFYADILITGSKSTLYTYENLHELNIETIYDENGMDNDQVFFKRLITSEEKYYQTVICFGDNHTWRQTWSNTYNRNTKSISLEDGINMSKWKCNKLINFHTSNKYYGTEHIAGYGDCFSHKEVEHIEDWVKYLD